MIVRMIMPLLIASLLAGSVTVAGIALRPGMGGVGDLGATRCATFTAMHAKGQTGSRQAILYLLEGYALGRHGKTLSDVIVDPALTQFDALTDTIVKHCAAHPTESVGHAVETIWPSLAPR